MIFNNQKNTAIGKKYKEISVKHTTRRIFRHKRLINGKKQNRSHIWEKEEPFIQRSLFLIHCFQRREQGEDWESVEGDRRSNEDNMYTLFKMYFSSNKCSERENTQSKSLVTDGIFLQWAFIVETNQPLRRNNFDYFSHFILVSRFYIKNLKILEKSEANNTT